MKMIHLLTGSPDEYGIRRKVTKDFEGSYTVDQYGHRQYVTDKTDEKNETTKETVETVEETDEIKYWVTNDDGTRVLASRNVPKSDKPKSPSKTSKSSEPKKSGSTDPRKVPNEDDSTTYWITDEYGIRRKVTKDYEASYTVDQYGHRQYATDKTDEMNETTIEAVETMEETDEVKYWVTNDDGTRVLASRNVPKSDKPKSPSEISKSSELKKSGSTNPRKVPDEEDSNTYWITDEYGIRRKVTKDYEASYTVDQYGHRQYVSDKTDEKNETTKETVETVEGTDEVKYWVTNDDGTRVLASRNVPKSDEPKSPSKTSKSPESRKPGSTDPKKKPDEDDSSTYWITDEYGIRRKVTKDFEASYTVDQYGHRQYVSDKTDEKNETTKETVETVEGTDEVKYWVTNDDGTRVLASRNVPKSDKPKSPSKTSKSSGSKKPGPTDPKKIPDEDDSTTYWITDEYGIRRKVTKDFEASYTVDQYGHRQYVTDKTDEKTETTKETVETVEGTDEVKYWVTNDDGTRVLASRNVPKSDKSDKPELPSNTSKSPESKNPGSPDPKKIPDEDDSSTYWITDEYGIRRKVTKDFEASYTVDQYGHRQYVTDITDEKNETTKETVETVEGTHEVKYWVTNDDGTRVLASRNAPKSDKPKSPSKTGKSPESKKPGSTDPKKIPDEDDSTTYWITDEYGIRRKVTKDFEASYTVDQYGHRQYVSDKNR